MIPPFPWLKLQTHCQDPVERREGEREGREGGREGGKDVVSEVEIMAKKTLVMDQEDNLR